MEHTFSGAGETGKIRNIVLPYIKDLNNGLDIGYGGDPIQPSAITLDTPKGEGYFGGVGSYPHHLKGFAQALYWFKASVLDYVYSSHCLEDFPNPVPVLNEWLRVLKPGGLLLLYLPNERKFKDVCNRTGQVYNTAHSNDDMGLDYMKKLFENQYKEQVQFVFGMEEDFENSYSFLIIVKKIEYGMASIA